MEYKILYEPFPVVLFDLENNEEVSCQGGAMSWCSPNMEMQTTSNGGLGKVFGRLFTGESLFMNRFIARGKGYIAFSSHFVGTIIPVEIRPGRDFIVQKTGFLASYGNVEQTVHFQKRLSTTFLGGEGLVMQRFSGNGIVFVEIDGYCKEHELASGERMILNTGYLAAMDATCDMDVEMVKGAKNILLGGEGLANTVVTGPGKIYIQTKPIAQLAKSLKPYFPTQTSTSSSKD